MKISLRRSVLVCAVRVSRLHRCDIVFGRLCGRCEFCVCIIFALWQQLWCALFSSTVLMKLGSKSRLLDLCWCVQSGYLGCIDYTQPLGVRVDGVSFVCAFCDNNFSVHFYRVTLMAKRYQNLAFETCFGACSLGMSVASIIYSLWASVWTVWFLCVHFVTTVLVCIFLA